MHSGTWALRALSMRTIANLLMQGKEITVEDALALKVVSLPRRNTSPLYSCYWPDRYLWQTLT